MIGKSQSQSQSQDLGSRAIGVQANGNVTLTVGVAVEEIRAVASDIFKADFVRLMDRAEILAEARAKKVLDDYLERVAAVNPYALNYADDPDFRYALFAAQKASARSGDPHLQDILVEMLVQRSLQDPRSLIQLVLNESLDVVPRITNGQINALVIAFVMQRVEFSVVSTFENFLKTMDAYIAPFSSNIATSMASFSHIEYSGCGVVGSHKVQLAETFQKFYPGIFQQGVTEADVRVKGLSNEARSLLVQCEHNAARVQVMGGTKEMLNAICNQKRIGEKDRGMLDQIFRQAGMTAAQIREKCMSARPYFAQLFAAWDDTCLAQFHPSSIGIAIAHANLVKCGSMRPLSFWIA